MPPPPAVSLCEWSPGIQWAGGTSVMRPGTDGRTDSGPATSHSLLSRPRRRARTVNGQTPGTDRRRIRTVYLRIDTVGTGSVRTDAEYGVYGLEPFMEWVTRTGMNMEWVSGGYGYFFVKSFGAVWVLG